MAVIYITEADNTQHKFRLPADEGVAVSIGRNEDCLISLPGVLGLSGLHCSIVLAGGEYVITDEGSSNGTLDGERAISSESLREGVAYSIGNALLYFDAEAAVAAPAEAVAEAPLAEPIAVSEYAAYAEPAAVEEPQPEVAAPVAAAPVKKKRKQPSAVKLASRAMAAQKKKAQAMSGVSLVYVLLVLVLAFYGGMTLRHWVETGDFLAPFAGK